MNFADTTVATALFALLTLGATWLMLARWLTVLKQIGRAEAEQLHFGRDRRIGPTCSHPVLSAASAAWAATGQFTLEDLEEALLRSLDREIQVGEFHRQVAISGSFALTLAGFILSCGVADPAQLTHHVVPYFAFSLVGVALSIVGFVVDSKLHAHREECRILGSRLVQTQPCPVYEDLLPTFPAQLPLDLSDAW